MQYPNSSWSLPVYRCRFGIPRLLYLCIQGIHHVSFSWALGSGIESQGTIIGRDSAIHQLIITAKCPMKILDFSVVTFSSLSLSKFSSFGLNPVKWEQNWNKRSYAFSKDCLEKHSSKSVVKHILFHAAKKTEFGELPEIKGSGSDGLIKEWTQWCLNLSSLKVKIIQFTYVGKCSPQKKKVRTFSSPGKQEPK